MEGHVAMKVLLAHRHHLFRRGLEKVLSSDGDVEVLGEARDGEEAMKLAKETKPDVMVLDAEDPSAVETNTVERMLEASPASGVVVVATQVGSPRSARKLLAQGVSAYLDGNSSAEDLVAAVHTAANGSRDAGNALLSVPKAVLVEQEKLAKYGLSRRQLQVLKLAAQGLSNRQIAHALHLAEATVKRHLANLYPKLGVASRSEATRKALIQGWLDVGDLAQDVLRDHDADDRGD
jgi:DNA-binding NarL/FixJ family response regulator